MRKVLQQIDEALDILIDFAYGEVKTSDPVPPPKIVPSDTSKGLKAKGTQKGKLRNRVVNAIAQKKHHRFEARLYALKRDIDEYNDSLLEKVRPIDKTEKPAKSHNKDLVRENKDLLSRQKAKRELVDEPVENIEK